VYGEGARFFGHVAFPSMTCGYKMYGGNGGRNASRALHLRIQASDTKVKHCYKHQDSNMRLVSSVSNRQLAFATQTKVLCFVLKVSTKIKLTHRGEKCDIHKAVTSKNIQHSRFRPSQSFPHNVSLTITTLNVTGANQTSSTKISAKGPSTIGKKRIKTTYTNL